MDRKKGKDGLIVVFMDWEWRKEGWSCSTVCPMCLKRVLTEKEVRRIARMGYFYGERKVEEYLLKRKMPCLVYVDRLPKLRMEPEIGIERVMEWPVIFPLCGSCLSFLKKHRMIIYAGKWLLLPKEVEENMSWLSNNLPRKFYILYKDGTVVSPKSPYEYLDFLYGKKDLKRIEEW